MAIDQATKAVDIALARKVNELHRALLARLKAHRHARGNIEPHAARCITLKAKGGVGFGKVVVRADLNRTIRCVLNHEAQGTPTGVEGVVVRMWTVGQ